MLILQLALAATFLLSVVSEIRWPSSRSAFVGSVTDLGVRHRLARPIAMGVVAVELLVVVSVLIARLASVGLVLTIVMLVTFCGAIVSVMRRQMAVTCRCFGVGTEPLSGIHLARNVVVVLVAGVLLMTGPVLPWSITVRTTGATDLALAVVVGAVLACFVAMFDGLADVFSASFAPAGPSAPSGSRPVAVATGSTGV